MTGLEIVLSLGAVCASIPAALWLWDRFSP